MPNYYLLKSVKKNPKFKIKIPTKSPKIGGTSAGKRASEVGRKRHYLPPFLGHFPAKSRPKRTGKAALPRPSAAGSAARDQPVKQAPARTEKWPANYRLQRGRRSSKLLKPTTTTALGKGRQQQPLPPKNPPKRDLQFLARMPLHNFPKTNFQKTPCNRLKSEFQGRRRPHCFSTTCT